MKLFKSILSFTFPTAGILHYLIVLILWIRIQDLFITSISLVTYYTGFFIGNIYYNKSKTSLSRITGIFLTSHVITTILFLSYGYGYFSIIFSLLLGISIGGLLSLPSYAVLNLSKLIIFSLFPVVGTLIIYVYEVDGLLLFSGVFALILSIFLLFSLKIIVAKPKIFEDEIKSFNLDGWLICIGISLGGSIGTIFLPIIALEIIGINIIEIGFILSISLVITHIIGWQISKRKIIQEGLGRLLIISLFISILLIGLINDVIMFILLWTFILIDLSFLNSFIIIVNRNKKIFSEYKFSRNYFIISIFGPIIAFILWNINYITMFYFSALLLLIGWLGLRKLLKVTI